MSHQPGCVAVTHFEQPCLLPVQEANGVPFLPLCQRHQLALQDWHTDEHDKELAKEEAAWLTYEKKRLVAESSKRRAYEKKNGLVYFLQRPDGLIKIGYTTNLKQRVDALDPANVLHLVLLLKGSRMDEGAFHKRFKAARSHREWFYPTSELLQFIEESRPSSVKAQYGQPA